MNSKKKNETVIEVSGMRTNITVTVMYQHLWIEIWKYINLSDYRITKKTESNSDKKTFGDNLNTLWIMYYSSPLLYKLISACQAVGIISAFYDLSLQHLK